MFITRLTNDPDAKVMQYGISGTKTDFQELIENLTKAVEAGKNTHFSVTDSLFGETQIGINFERERKDN